MSKFEKTALLSLSHADIKNIKRINVRVTCTISHNFCALFGICSFIVLYRKKGGYEKREGI